MSITGAGDGIIAALDADCRCEESYLAAIVEHKSGRPFEQFLREEIFVPAGMVDARVEAMDRQIHGWLEAHRRGDVVPDNVSQEDLERLHALGYVP